jgi:hypothetical protein
MSLETANDSDRSAAANYARRNSGIRALDFMSFSLSRSANFAAKHSLDRYTSTA